MSDYFDDTVQALRLRVEELEKKNRELEKRLNKYENVIELPVEKRFSEEPNTVA
jgi:exonuclease VII small subunit